MPGPDNLHIFNIINQTEGLFLYFPSGIYLNKFFSDHIYSERLAASHADLPASHVPSCHCSVSLTHLSPRTIPTRSGSVRAIPKPFPFCPLFHTPIHHGRVELKSRSNPLETHKTGWKAAIRPSAQQTKMWETLKINLRLVVC